MNLDNVYRLNSKDYTANHDDAAALAFQIQEYYHKDGYTGVNVWVESVPIYNSDGARISMRYDIRSNIKFKLQNSNS